MDNEQAAQIIFQLRSNCGAMEKFATTVQWNVSNATDEGVVVRVINHGER